MKKLYWFLGPLTVVLVAVVGLMLTSSVERVASQAATPAGNDNLPTTTLFTAEEAAITVAQNGDGTRPIYFAPQDSNGTATVITLFNTDTISHTVIVQGLNRSVPGVFTVNTVVEVDPGKILYLLSDGLTDTSTPPPSWALNNVETNFTDSTSYGVLYIPPQIKFDGYVVYNPTSLIEPDQDQGARPIRFSTDPVDVFLPIMQKTP